MFETFINHSLVLVLIISAIPLVSSTCLGLIVAIFQTATQIQEQSVSYLVRLSAVVVVFLICGSWFTRELIGLFQETLSSIQFLGRL